MLRGEGSRQKALTGHHSERGVAWVVGGAEPRWRGEEELAQRRDGSGRS